jgi:predicted XRE-type DNA-binding protein
MYELSMALRFAPEYWQDIQGYEGYQVSNYGKVKNNKTGKILKPYLTRGYLRVSLYNESGRKCKLVHRLVAEAFLPNPHSKPAVNYINGCKTDSNVSNLEWVSASENMLHAHSSGLRPKVDTQGEKNGFAKLTEAQVIEIKQLLAEGSLTQKTIGSQFNISRSTVKDINSGRRWGHIKDVKAPSSANQRAA